MTLACLHRVGRLLGVAAMLVLGCAPKAAEDAGSTTDGSTTGGPPPVCEPVYLFHVARGVDGFALDGVNSYDLSGWSVSGLGDMNGDGLADMAVGAPNVGNAGSGPSGLVYVILGKQSTDKVELSQVLYGNGGFPVHGEAGSSAGESVSGAGDVNGDGSPDLVIGAWRFDANDLTASGRTYVVFGKADTEAVWLEEVAEGTGGFAMDGEETRDYAGWTVSGAGDVNGDGRDDVIVGARTADSHNLTIAGRSYVVFGKADTDTVSLAAVAGGSGGFLLEGETAHEGGHYGDSVSGAGDVNGDGLDDVIVGARPAWPVDPGDTDPHYGGDRVYVVFGKADTDSVSLADVDKGIDGFAVDGAPDHWLSSRSVGQAGDINGDGLADLIVGGGGGAYVVFGKADTDKVSTANVAQGIGGFVLERDSVYAGSVGSMSAAGDINGDGMPDLVMGAAGAWANDSYQSGRAYVVLGQRGTDKVRLDDVVHGIGGFAMNGEAEQDELGRSVRGAGDVNGDGLADVIVGAHGAAPDDRIDAGRTYVVFGRECPDVGG